MSSFRGWIMLAVAVASVVLLPSCQRKPVAQGPFYIMLTWNGGACQQNGSPGVIEVPYDENVIFQGAAVLSQFQVQFPNGSCPFASCPVNSPNGNAVNVGKPNPNAGGNTYNYSGMMIDNQQCNPAPTGMRIKPGP